MYFAVSRTLQLKIRKNTTHYVIQTYFVFLEQQITFVWNENGEVGLAL